MYISWFQSVLITETLKYCKFHSLNNKNGFQWGEVVWSVLWGAQHCLPCKNIKGEYNKKENKMFYFIRQWIKIHCSSMRNSHQYMSFRGRDTSTSWQELQCLLLALHHCIFQVMGLCFQFPVISVLKENHEMESRGGGDTILCYVVHCSQTGFVQIWLMCQSWWIFTTGCIGPFWRSLRSYLGRKKVGVS